MVEYLSLQYINRINYRILYRFLIIMRLLRLHKARFYNRFLGGE